MINNPLSTLGQQVGTNINSGGPTIPGAQPSTSLSLAPTPAPSAAAAAMPPSAALGNNAPGVVNAQQINPSAGWGQNNLTYDPGGMNATFGSGVKGVTIPPPPAASPAAPPAAVSSAPTSVANAGVPGFTRAAGGIMPSSPSSYQQLLAKGLQSA